MWNELLTYFIVKGDMLAQFLIESTIALTLLYLRRLAALRVEHLEVRYVDRSLLLDDATLRILRVGLRGLLADVHALDNRTRLRHLDLQDLALLAFAVTRDDLNHIPFLNMQFH